jgi:hypothetical protein
MMALPFLAFTIALICALVRLRVVALVIWGVTLVFSLVLFKLHATDVLPLDF